MNKKSIITLILFFVLSASYIVFAERIYDFLTLSVDNTVLGSGYLKGEAVGEKGKIGLKLKVDNSGAIKEVIVMEHTDSEIAINALQKLIDNSLDKESSSEIDSVSGATDTSNTYKAIIKKLLMETEKDEKEDDTEKISLTEQKNMNLIERQVVNETGYKTGLGGYVFNTLQDADYNKNGNLVINEYICAVILNPYNRIEDVKFDHIISNISFDKYGRVPTGGAKAYNFPSDKSQVGFNGLVNDGNYVDMFDFEKQVLTYRHFEDIKNRYINKKGYAPLIYALENAIDNARFVGASNGDTLGLAVSKVLKKKDIMDATDTENGYVNFISNYCLITVDKSQIISACMFDNVINKVTLTNDGKILGSRQKEIYTLNEIANTNKYSRIEKSRFDLKVEYNTLCDFVRGNTIDNILKVISDEIDDRGYVKPDMSFSDLKDIDFIDVISLISKAFAEAIKIKAS